MEPGFKNQGEGNFLLEVPGSPLNHCHGAGMAGMNDEFALAEECRRLAVEFNRYAATTTDAGRRQTLEQFATSYLALARSWLDIREAKEKLRQR